MLGMVLVLVDFTPTFCVHVVMSNLLYLWPTCKDPLIQQIESLVPVMSISTTIFLLAWNFIGEIFADIIIAMTHKIHKLILFYILENFKLYGVYTV